MQKLENFVFLKVFLSDLKTLSIRIKIKTITPPIVHGEDSTPVTFFEQVELAEFHGCCSAFVFVWDSGGQWDWPFDPLDGGSALDAVYSSTASWHSAYRRKQFLWRLLYRISKTFSVLLLQEGSMHCPWKGPVRSAVLKIRFPPHLVKLVSNPTHKSKLRT